MLKDVDIVVYPATWPSKIPHDIAAIVGTRSIDIDVALLHTAIWTRPPVFLGFSLNDMWAWLRYQHAFSKHKHLRLKTDWDLIDAHQKTILSDELGVGFTTQLFIEELDFRLYADARYVVNMLAPQLFKYVKRSRRGPNKTPDFIALDSNLNISILECKGTQTSHEALNAAIQRGLPQKQNLSPKGPWKIKHSLVAGLFVPQSSNYQNAIIHIADPDYEIFYELLSQIPFPVLQQAVLQISLAKHFALVGLFQIAGVLSKTHPTALEDNMQKIIQRIIPDFKNVRIQRDGFISLSSQLPSQSQEIGGEEESLFKNCTIRCPEKVFSKWFTLENWSEELTRMLNGLRDEEVGWEVTGDEARTELVSPLGFQLILE